MVDAEGASITEPPADLLDGGSGNSVDDWWLRSVFTFHAANFSLILYRL